MPFQRKRDKRRRLAHGTSLLLAALAPPAETFKKGRDFAAWMGLTPLQRSTGGKQKLGATSKMGERTYAAC